MKRRSSKGRSIFRHLFSSGIGVICALGICQSESFAQSMSEPFTLRENFQHDSLGQMASYPPPQDYGYEPSITPTSDHNPPGGRALMRVIKPNRDGQLRFGFIRQSFLRMNEDAKISFAYFLNHAAPGDEIEIGIAGGDGCRYVERIPAKTKSWTTEEIKLK